MMIFDKRQTNIAKGVAVLLLLWHHLFYNDPKDYNKFISLLKIDNVPIECVIADSFKVCVAIFLLLSGYGLYRSYQNFCNETIGNNRIAVKKDFKFVWNHWIKMMSGYWFIYIIFVPMGIFFGRSFLTYYGLNPIYYLTEFLGLTYLFFEYNVIFNATWWFMSVIIVLYIIFPLLHKLLTWQSEITLSLSILFMFVNIPFLHNINYWFAPFIFGMYISKYNLFARILNLCDTLLKKIILSILLIVVSLYIRITFFKNAVYFDAFFAFAIILFSYMVLSNIPKLSKTFEILGKHSANIFMFHTFIYSYYFQSIIYSPKYSLLIYIFMVLVCLFISLGLEYLKKITRYNKLFLKLRFSV